MKQQSHWMPLLTGEFLTETANLNTTQIGAYTLLLIHYWHKRSLPDNNTHLARITRMTTRGWLNIRPIIETLFHRGWTHPRLDHELARADLQHAKRVAAGSKGGNKTAMNNFTAAYERDSKSHKKTSPFREKDHLQVSTNALETLQRRSSNAVPALKHNTTQERITTTVYEDTKLALQTTQPIDRDFVQHWKSTFKKLC